MHFSNVLLGLGLSGGGCVGEGLRRSQWRWSFGLCNACGPLAARSKKVSGRVALANTTSRFNLFCILRMNDFANELFVVVTCFMINVLKNLGESITPFIR